MPPLLPLPLPLHIQRAVRRGYGTKKQSSPPVPSTSTHSFIALPCLALPCPVLSCMCVPTPGNLTSFFNLSTTTYLRFSPTLACVAFWIIHLSTCYSVLASRLLLPNFPHHHYLISTLCPSPPHCPESRRERRDNSPTTHSTKHQKLSISPSIHTVQLLFTHKLRTKRKT